MFQDLNRVFKTLLVLFLSLDIDFPGKKALTFLLENELHQNLFIGVFGEAVDHLEMGKKLLQEGNLPEALRHYNMAVCMLRLKYYIF